jgi:branched-chain amino acid transport system ATP-binding protein
VARADAVLTLAVRDLAVRFGGVAALAGVSFDVLPGTITSVIGPNGAGKTTAFDAITGYLRPARGRIEYAGLALTGLRPSAVAARGIVRTFQRTSVFPSLSVAANVMIGLHLRGTAGFLDVVLGRRRLAVEEARLAHDADGILEFVGLGHRRGATASELPYGEQRLVELAVALAARPRLLLLDEPGAGMTTAEKATVGDLIYRVRDQGTTVLLVEHDMRMVMGISDTVIVLNHGRVIAEGPPAFIQAHPDVIRAYLGSTGDRD